VILCLNNAWYDQALKRRLKRLLKRGDKKIMKPYLKIESCKTLKADIKLLKSMLKVYFWKYDKISNDNINRQIKEKQDKLHYYNSIGIV